VKNATSNLAKITYGVPQGSCLGPILFFLYINDIPLATKFNTTLFADDTYLSFTDKDLTLLEKCVNNELKKLKLW